ncbi:putative dehydrogenase [Okibacterium sp. HSC-33S16]|uniref:Gfo/Idh/MocA family protein n=1 Tax=Okibacterium sp. HSC-33S16 TaxID=2910965 RepID=UPI00209D9B69|nr:Gfo/Idh/MocA family oxidoreductase [Okibacterium sp. HSC-33S16]MCP2031998.1 putative dehydrogenase [Okibacterium sp. HSC-33S16]
MSTAAPTNSPLRAALVGTGSVARLHAEALALLPHVELVAAADPLPGRAAEFASTHSIPAAFESLEELLTATDVDVVHLCTPPGGHAKQTRLVFEAGAHVIVEKPPALSLAEVDEMTDAARTAGKYLAVVFQQRTGTAATHVKALLDSGALGRPLLATCSTLWYRGSDYYSVPWRGKWDTEGGGTTLSHGIHQVDLLAYLLGEWATVNGQLWRLARDLETEDASTGTIVFESGAVASVLSSVVSPREASVIRIDTENATIELEHLYGHGHANWRITPAAHVSEADAAAWEFPDAEEPSGHDALLFEVYSALAQGDPLPAVAAEPTRALEIVAALYASAREGISVDRSRVVDEPALRGGMRSPVTDLRPDVRPGLDTTADREVGPV